MRLLKYWAGIALAVGMGCGSSADAATPATTTNVSFTVVFPLRNADQAKALAAAQANPQSPSYRKWLSHDQVASQFGLTSDQIAAATAALTAKGFSVDAIGINTIKASGPASVVNSALRINLKTVTDVQSGAVRTVSATKPLLPAALAQMGANIPSFSPAPLRLPHSVKLAAVPENRNGPNGFYNYNDLKQAYDYPAYQTAGVNSVRTLDGSGVNVAVVMADLASNSDVAAMFDHEHFTTTTGKPDPTFNTVLIDGGGTLGGYGSFEASLDVQQVLGGAPGANVTLYSTPNLGDGALIDAYVAIINESKKPIDIVTSSFGGCELAYLPAYNNGLDFSWILGDFDYLFLIGNLEGITFMASSGDEGGLSCPNNTYFAYGATSAHFVASVEQPASSPFVTAVGGGNLQTVADGTLNSAYAGENAYGDPEVAYDPYGYGINVTGGYWGAGGGVSAIEPRPWYQSGTLPGRSMPDVGMMVGGCPGGLSQQPCGPDRSAAIVTYFGSRYGVIGTSVSSPEFAGAVALAVQYGGGKMGNINPMLYQLGAQQVAAGGASAPSALQYYHMNIYGNDGVYVTTPTTGYNFITGNGTPHVRALLGMSAVPPAGLPRTLSNP